MSREDIERAISEVCLILRPPNDTLISCRQLAVGVIEHLLAQERKKVREMCADIAENPYGDEVEAFMGETPQLVGDKISDAIRQLDLTKDLAPSTDKGKG